MGRYRLFVSFLVASLAVPVFLAVIGHPGKSVGLGYATIVLDGAVASLCAIPFLRAPAYVSLQAEKWTAFWIAPLVGIGVAAAALFAMNFLMTLALGPTLLSSLADLSWAAGILWPYGP